MGLADDPIGMPCRYRCSTVIFAWTTPGRAIALAAVAASAISSTADRQQPAHSPGYEGEGRSANPSIYVLISKGATTTKAAPGQLAASYAGTILFLGDRNSFFIA